MIKSRFLFVIILPLISLQSIAQEQTIITSDFEVWANAGISKKINNKIKVNFTNEFRFNTNATNFDIYFSEFGIDYYPFKKYITLGFDYRFYQNENKKNIFETEHRISGDLKLNYEIKRFDISYRLRVQNKDEDFYKKEFKENNIINFRNKIQLDYNIKKSSFNPYISTEIFRISEDNQTAFFNKIRYSIGCGYKIKKVGTLDLFYKIDNGLNVTYPKTIYILGAGFNYKL